MAPRNTINNIIAGDMYDWPQQKTTQTTLTPL